MKTSIRKRITGLLATLMVLALLPQAPTAYAVQYQFNNASLEISDSNPASVANWTITFTTVQEIPISGTIVITPEATLFSIPVGTDFEDIDLTVAAAEMTLAAAPDVATWGVAVVTGTSGSITLTNGTDAAVPAASAIVIEIGTHATQGSTGNSQITNPAKTAGVGTADIRTVDVTSTTAVPATIDTIDLLVAIIEDIDIYGSQKPQMTFTIAGQTAPDGGSIAANYIEWKEVTPGVAKTAVMRVKVNTDAKDGFYVYVIQNHNMQHSEDAGIDIDLIKNNVTVGTNAAPVAWFTPGGTTIGADTGFLGYHTSDATLGTGTTDRFSVADTFAGLTTTSSEVLFHGAASQSDVDGQDRADVTFKLQTNNLQPSGNYSNEITFIAKPIF